MRTRAQTKKRATKINLRMIRAKIKIKIKIKTKRVKSPSWYASISRTSDNAFWRCLFRPGIM